MLYLFNIFPFYIVSYLKKILFPTLNSLEFITFVEFIFYQFYFTPLLERLCVITRNIHRINVYIFLQA